MTGFTNALFSFSAVRCAGNLVLDALYPRRCPLCQNLLAEEERLICRRCGPHLPYIREPRCRLCGRQVRSQEAEYCADCSRAGHIFTEGRAAFRYEGALRDSLMRMKFHNRREYAPFFAAAMAAHEHAFLRRIAPDCMIPIPMNPRKRRERGFDQCALLAGELSRLTGIPVKSEVLCRIRYTRPQKGLSAHERKMNLRDALYLNGTIAEGERILLLDDIYTTGATMDEAARTLKAGGAGEIYFLTVCIGSGREEVEKHGLQKKTGMLYYTNLNN